MKTDDDRPSGLAGIHTGYPTGNSDRDGIRQRLKQLRQQLNPETATRHSRGIAVNLLPLLGEARHLGGYLAYGNEVAVDELMAQHRAQGRSTYVPLIQPDHTLVFAPITDTTVIMQNKYGIREPVVDREACLPATSLDVVLVPLLGFDALCNRMGMGGGYYDRTFAHKRQAAETASASAQPQLIGVAFESQRVDDVYSDWWDVPLDNVVTEERIYSR